MTEQLRAQADLEGRRARRPAEGGAVPADQRPLVGGEHLPGRAGRRPREPEALVTLLLAITDQFAERPAEGARRAQELLPRLDDEYKRTYYAGIVAERGAKAHLRRATVASGELAYHLFREAMEWYEKAEGRRPPGNDEAILRWNTCARILARDEHIRPRLEEAASPGSE